MNDELLCSNLRQVILDKVSIANRARVSREVVERHIEVGVQLDYMVNAFLVTLYSFQPGKKDGPIVISYPKTWWDAFKERWFPTWLLLRYPAHMMEHTIERGCTYPTIHIGQGDHLPMAFMQHVEMDYFIPSQEEHDE